MDHNPDDWPIPVSIVIVLGFVIIVVAVVAGRQ